MYVSRLVFGRKFSRFFGFLVSKHSTSFGKRFIWLTLSRLSSGNRFSTSTWRPEQFLPTVFQRVGVNVSSISVHWEPLILSRTLGRNRQDHSGAAQNRVHGAALYSRKQSNAVSSTRTTTVCSEMFRMFSSHHNDSVLLKIRRMWLSWRESFT